MTKPRILIVEDEGILAKGLEMTLTRQGHLVAGIAASGEEALTLAEEVRPDLVLMDIRLRGKMDGIEAAAEIRKRWGIPVIYLTAYADEETLRRAKVTEPHGYLVKPFDEKTLLISIEMTLFKKMAEDRDRKAMEQLRLANARIDYQRGFFKALFEAIPDGVLVLDSEARVRASNPHVQEMLGFAPQRADDLVAPGEVLGCAEAGEKGIRCLSGCGKDCMIRNAISMALSGERVRRVKAAFQLSAGDRFREKKFLVSATATEFDGEKLCILILEDVTELDVLKHLLKAQHSFSEIVGADPAIREVFKTIAEVADSAVPVLIEGESGTGKELVALAVHKEGPRARKPFVAVNCGALPDGLLESELFGHVRGAFTGAVKDKKGRFELADGGTLFLDEVGELGPSMQVKLLRVLQEKTFDRVGGEHPVRVDVRVVSATNRDLRKEVSEGRFRRDLFYRLCVVPIHMPPLRERKGDIPLLAEHLLKRIAKEKGIPRPEISGDVLERLLAHPWPGNVRELENVLQFALLKNHGQVIGLEHLPTSVHAPPATGAARRPRQRKLQPEEVDRTLRETGGNRVEAARRLGVSRATLYRSLDESREGTGVGEPSGD